MNQLRHASLVFASTVLLLTVSCSNKTEIRVTIQADTSLSSGILDSITTLDIAVDGAESWTTSYPVTDHFLRRQETWLYRPAVSSGSINFVVTGRNANGLELASGEGKVTVKSKSAATATVVLTPSSGQSGGDMGPIGTGLPGDACGSDDSCASGFCADGVCCKTRCGESCYSCALAGAPGTCTLVPPGSDPRDECKDDGTACGLDGTCDGAGGCRYRTTDTVCKPASCSNGVLTKSATCDGKGACQTPTTRQCDPYVCKPDGSDCYSMCSDGTACKPPNSCAMGSCGKAANGAMCTGPDQCQTGKCVDGYCCNDDCTSACNRCNVPGKEGICSPVAVNTDDARCPHDGQSTCQHTGTCTVTGTCAFWPSTTVCAAATCSSDTWSLIQQRTCPGGGQACPPPPTPTFCNGYRCNNAACTNDCGACQPSCSIIPITCGPHTGDCYSGGGLTYTCTNTCSTKNHFSCQ